MSINVECTHELYPNQRCGSCDEKPWLCDGCGHRLYEHGTRREPNSGKRYYGACGVKSCGCSMGHNRLYRLGLIDS